MVGLGWDGLGLDCAEMQLSEKMAPAVMKAWVVQLLTTRMCGRSATFILAPAGGFCWPPALPSGPSPMQTRR